MEAIVVANNPISVLMKLPVIKLSGTHTHMHTHVHRHTYTDNSRMRGTYQEVGVQWVWERIREDNEVGDMIQRHH